MLDGIRGSWVVRPDGNKDGLVLFSGDIFSPSVESSVTRGSHMVPVINELAPDVSLTGNHDFDFGYPHLTKLIQDTKFPWLLSNIVDTSTSRVPEHLHEYHILERAGVKVGVIGLIEKEWIGTISSWPDNFEYRDMAEVGTVLSQRLRGELGCDLVIALTHARVPNDIAVAKALGALSPTAQKDRAIAGMHGVDLILGGHDHLYYVSRGVSAWDEYDTAQAVLGAEEDKGDVLVIKSGTDFRDLSSFELELEDTPPGSVRRKVIKRIVGKHYATKPGSPSSDRLKALLKDVLDSVSSTLKAPVCRTAVALDVRSQFIRTAESAAGNWFADIIRHAYDDALTVKGYGGVDSVLICAGMLRGDSIYGPGDITLGDILEILPFEDPLVVIELDGAVIWAALEAALSTWPAQEGRFPVLAGLRVEWESARAPGARVRSVRLLKERAAGGAPGPDDEEDVPREGGRKYALLTREYMAQGHDGFVALKGQKYLVDDETGQMMSAIVRKYLLGSVYVHRMARQPSVDQAGSAPSEPALHGDTQRILSRERERRAQHRPHDALAQWRLDAAKALHTSRQCAHYKDHIGVAEREHMSAYDCFDGASVRGGRNPTVPAGAGAKGDAAEADLLTIHPEVDGRLRDASRS